MHLVQEVQKFVMPSRKVPVPGEHRVLTPTPLHLRRPPKASERNRALFIYSDCITCMHMYKCYINILKKELNYKRMVCFWKGCFEGCHLVLLLLLLLLLFLHPDIDIRMNWCSSYEFDENHASLRTCGPF